MRTFFISDIHGHYHALIQLLEHVNWSPLNDRLIIGGDLINRGPDSAKVLEFARHLSVQHPQNVHVLCGNHEEMMIWYFYNKSPMWLQHGGLETLLSFKKQYGEGWAAAEEFIHWLETLPLTYEDEHAVYTHAGIHADSLLFEQPRDILWLTIRDVKLQSRTELSKRSGGKPIFRGHSPVREVTADGAYIHCDLGMGVLPPEHSALALVDVKEHVYWRCQLNGTITKHAIKS
ncbi:metallophosphoesterase family protein [Ectobacillus panaciterrae]|uniref:metallophosphoesterase family protein n=1 Tax=Ectobacillus panaciterrae TaxID=363872 RepID=UPI0003FF4840|nr:metallophosphoesterase family protein [Ectobacillus panaciterrae]